MSGSGMIVAQRDVPTREGYPWAGHPRIFTAVAMPNGDARFGVAGELVRLTERNPMGGHVRERLLSRGEAEQLVQELRGALRAFDHARALVEGLAPAACTAPYPFAGNRTLAEIDGADMGHVAQDEAA